MADKSTVTFKMSAESAAFVQACEQARQKLMGVADASRSAGGAVTSFGDLAANKLSNVVNSASSVVFSMAGIGSVVGVVAGSFTAGMDRMREKSDKLRESLSTVEDVLYRLNRMQDLPEIRARLSKIGEGVTTRENVEGIYKSTAGHLGSRATEAQLESAVGASMNVIRGGGSPELAAGFANTFGDFRTMRGKMERVSDADLAEISSAVLRVRGDGLSEKELKFIANSDDPIKAVDFILAAAKNHDNPKAIESLASRAESEITAADIRDAKGPERERLQRLSKIPAAGRLAAWLNDATLAPTQERRELEGITRNLGADAEAAIAGKPFAGGVETFKKLVATDPAAGAKFGLDRAGVAKSETKEKGEVGAITEDAIWTEYERLMQEGKISKGVLGFLPAGRVTAFHRGLSDWENWGTGVHDTSKWHFTDEGYYQARDSLYQKTGLPLPASRPSSLLNGPAGTPANNEFNPVAKLQERIIRALEANTAATVHNTQSNNGEPNLRNDSVGQQ